MVRTASVNCCDGIVRFLAAPARRSARRYARNSSRARPAPRKLSNILVRRLIRLGGEEGRWRRGQLGGLARQAWAMGDATARRSCDAGPRPYLRLRLQARRGHRGRGGQCARARRRQPPGLAWTCWSALRTPQRRPHLAHHRALRDKLVFDLRRPPAILPPVSHSLPLPPRASCSLSAKNDTRSRRGLCSDLRCFRLEG